VGNVPAVGNVKVAANAQAAVTVRREAAAMAPLAENGAVMVPAEDVANVRAAASAPVGHAREDREPADHVKADHVKVDREKVVASGPAAASARVVGNVKVRLQNPRLHLQRQALNPKSNLLHMADDIIISPDTLRENRLPPNQVRTMKWPVLDYGGPPARVDLTTWKFKVFGLVKNPQVWTWEEFRSLPRVKVKADFHCVTRWSRLDNLWEGVSTREILSRAEAAPEARFVLVHAYDSGWTTNLPLEHFQSQDALFADTHDGEPLTLEHGGPLRLVIPQLYAWKSAKWVRSVEFLAEDTAGYWEDGGYHMRGDPWNEERYR